MQDSTRGDLGLWHSTLPGPHVPRPALERDEQVDVAIVGAGYSGLWTAYYLKSLDPGVRVAIVESEFAGWGASGRNGGWAVGSAAGLDHLIGDPSLHDGALRLQRALFDAVDEIGRVSEREGIDCHYAKGGWISVASAPAQRERLLADVADWHAHGLDESDVRWMEPAECAARVRPPRNLGGILFAHCAALHPARLATGLARAVERKGVAIYERSPALAIEPGRVRLRGATLAADVVVRATEGFTRSLRGEVRRLVPMHSMMVATEPLSESTWKEIGLEARETFSDARRIVVYGQRTADGRMAFGSRGRYLYGSAIPARFADASDDYARVERLLHFFFPVLRDAPISHRWFGPVAVPRSWRPSVGVDRRARLAWIGGYVGEGVAASNLAGRTLAETILERASERTGLPLVGPPPPLWEPEPLRWLGVQGVLRLGQWLDASELAGRSAPALASAIFRRFVRA